MIGLNQDNKLDIVHASAKIRLYFKLTDLYFYLIPEKKGSVPEIQ